MTHSFIEKGVTVRVWDKQSRSYIEKVIDCHISIDVAGIARQLGAKAAGNKSRRAHEIGGLVEVKLA